MATIIAAGATNEAEDKAFSSGAKKISKKKKNLKSKEKSKENDEINLREVVIVALQFSGFLSAKAIVKRVATKCEN